MASYNELIALIDAFIKRNGVQAITGQILNGVLKAMVDQVGRGYAIIGVATPSTNPGTPDAPESWFASTPGTYTNFGGLEVADAEFALLSYTPSGEVWTKTTLTEGIQEVSASIDGNVGTPEVTAEYINGGLIFTFSNMKGQTGDAAGFGTVNATVDGNIGTPGVSVNTSGPDTAKNITFAFRNLKGETGVTSVVATVDNTSGAPSCAVSLVGQELHLDFHGLKGAQGDTGVSADFPITIANNLTTDDPTAALSAAQGVVLAGELSQLEAKVDNYEDKTFLAIKEDFNNTPNVASFDNFDGTDVISLVGSFTASYAGNVITATKTNGGGGSVAFNLAKLNLITGEKYFIAVRRTGEKSKTMRMFIYRGTTSSSVGGLVTTLKRSAEFLYGTFVASGDRFLSSETYYSETTIEYEVYLCKLSEIEKFTEMAKEANVVSKSNEAILSDGLGLDGNAAEFSGYSDASVIYNPAGKSVSFSGNEIIVTNTYPAGNGYVGISLDGIGLVPGEHYFIRLYGNTDSTNFSIRKNATTSFIGENVASFSLKDGYILADFVAQAGLTITLYQNYQREISIVSAYICKEYTLPANLTYTKNRDNFANRMDWVALDGSSTGVSAVKGEDGAVVAASGSGNSIAVFSLPQLPGGRSYTFRIECSTLIGTQAIKNANGGANRYEFTADNGVYTLVISDYQEYIYPLKLWLLLKYNVTSHNIKFYITDNAVPEERQVVKNEALSGIDEQNFSEGLLGRCDFLLNNPTLYKGMDICAFNKGICIGDSLTAGSMNTTDAQGNDGPALQTLRGNAFTVARSYPAKLAKLTGIEITTVAQGGITSYDFYETFKDQDWSGHEFAIIELGRNDVAQPPIGYGTWTEQSVTGFTNIINKLKTENPGIKIFVCNDTNIVGNKELWDLIDGIEQLVSDLNDPDVILLDMHKYGRLNSTNAYQCGHLTQYGYYRLAQDYCNYISWYMATHKEEFRFIQFIGTNYVYTKEF